MTALYTTSRLYLNKLTFNDAPFILELVNTKGWLQFIGDRNVRNLDDASEYVTSILNRTDVTYWVVRLSTGDTAIGVITFIKRPYLEHHDIGFAFLPEYNKKGYAYEAANVVLQDVLQKTLYEIVLAITVQANTNSVKLLERLGFCFENTIESDGETLLVYKFKK